MTSAARIPPPVLEKTFVLKFWFEWSELEASHWRGKVRDDQVDPRGIYRPVANPENALEFVRDALSRATPAAYAIVSDPGNDSATANAEVRPLRRAVLLFHEIIRRSI